VRLKYPFCFLVYDAAGAQFLLEWLGGSFFFDADLPYVGLAEGAGLSSPANPLNIVMISHAGLRSLSGQSCLSYTFFSPHEVPFVISSTCVHGGWPRTS
jgi:hypothetical protein